MRRPGSRDSATRQRVTTIANTPTGMFTKKIPRQLQPVVITPPRTGPTATATPVTAPHTANAVPRSRPWNAWASSASDVANMIAPPIPCPARAATRNSGPVASAHSSDPAVNTASPIVNSSRRPNMSASEPAVSSSAASDSAYASTTHCSCAKLACNSSWMLGSATFTIVMSTSSMNVPRQTASKVQYFRSTALSLLGTGFPRLDSRVAGKGGRLHIRRCLRLIPP